jgi:hypothetical protein
MFNRNVTRHSYGKKEMTDLVLLTESVAASDFLDSRVLMNHHDKIEREVKELERVNDEKRAISIVVEHSLIESQLPTVINNLNQKGREIIFKDILFEMFMGSLVLDESFRVQEEHSFRILVESYVNDNGGYDLLKRSYASSKSPILKAVLEVCESISGKVCTRKMCECQNGSVAVQDINFDLNDEEKDQFNYEKGNLNLDQLSGMVKDKVITVIKDEKSRQAKEEELQNDLLAQAEEDGTTVQEAYTAYVISNTTVGVEEASLFNSLFRHTYKTVLESVAVNAGGELELDNDNMDAHVNSSMDDASRNEYNPYTMKKALSGDYNVRDEINNSDDNNLMDNDTIRLDMDLVLAESITKYTLMEMAYTIKLEDYDYVTLQKISQKLLN